VNLACVSPHIKRHYRLRLQLFTQVVIEFEGAFLDVVRNGDVEEEVFVKGRPLYTSSLLLNAAPLG